MEQPSKIQIFIWKLQDWRQWFCNHVIEFQTMDDLKEMNWDRISGSGSCYKCGKSFHVSIPKNREESMELQKES